MTESITVIITIIITIIIIIIIIIRPIPVLFVLLDPVAILLLGVLTW